ncbi:MAG: 50S ribosome-binding GTPase [Planctomycetes bacterium]|nr:50S ribosome-binding GTPase [Planctomycetota bacterium]MCB9918953.1 50S ribosome-binding GTPase [Planctomycetota bacterium]
MLVRAEAHTDTIFALATPSVAADRGAFRISGNRAFEVVASIVRGDLPRERRVLDIDLELPGKWSSCVVLPARLLLFPAPGSYTGEDVVEVHTIISPSIAELLEDVLLGRGLRPAGPGEFTRRAFEHEKLDLRQAEAVLAVIQAEDEAELVRATRLLQGTDENYGSAWREELVDLIALLESGLDFEEGETGAVDAVQWVPRLEGLVDRMEQLLAEDLRMERSSLPSFVLVGPPNAGKTSLWNALRRLDGPADVASLERVGADNDDAIGLVSPLAGTTRDVRWARVSSVRIGDAPGRDGEGPKPSVGDGLPPGDDELAILTHEIEQSDGYVHVLPLAIVAARAGGDEFTGAPLAGIGAPVLRIATQSDLAGAAPQVLPGWLSCSAITGEGLREVRDALDGLAVRARAKVSAHDLQVRVQVAIEALRRALDGREHGDEVVVAELAEAVAALAPSDAASVPEELLDRIFARFCLGK